MPGESCEFDWGEATLIIGGEKRNISLFRKRHIEEDEYDKEYSRITRLINEADSEIKRLEMSIQDCKY
jgi:hypothetical protein